MSDDSLAQWRRENCAHIKGVIPISMGLIVSLSSNVDLHVKAVLNTAGAIVTQDGFAVYFPRQNKECTLWEILGIPELKP